MFAVSLLVMVLVYWAVINAIIAVVTNHHARVKENTFHGTMLYSKSVVPNHFQNRSNAKLSH